MVRCVSIDIHVRVLEMLSENTCKLYCASRPSERGMEIPVVAATLVDTDTLVTPMRGADWMWTAQPHA